MKFATLFLISVLIIFMFTTPSLSSTTTEPDDLVYDTAGKPLETGVSYIISPSVVSLPTSLRLLTPSENNETCEADVILDYIYYSTPFTFTPVNPNEDVIKLGTPVAIQSPTVNPCGSSTIWKVSSRDGLSSNVITSGGISNTPDSCLRIVKPPMGLFPFYSYVFEYCPNMCGVGPKICRTLGIYGSDGYQHLSTGGMTFSVVFIKQSELAPKIDLASSMMNQM